MIAKTNLSVIVFLFILFYACGENREPQTKEQAENRTQSLQLEYDQNIKQENYQLCLKNLNEILELSKQFDFQKDFIFKITDNKQYILQKLEKFDEALKVAFELEEMSQQIGKRESPWNYLKIADSYLGLQILEKTIEWMEKAVYERGFKKYKFFNQEKYKLLRSDINFQKMIRYMKDSIGLQHPAKDFEIKLLNGEKFKLSYQKGKVVLIDFWDIYCPPCIKAIPELKRLHTEYNIKGLEIIGISLDTDEVKLHDFLKKYDMPWKIACSYKGFKDDVAILYGINATPSTWLIDRNGVLQHYNLHGKELKDMVKKLCEDNKDV